MKKFAPLCASLLLLAACSTGGQTTTTAAPQSTSKDPETTSTAPAVLMTTIDPGKLYIDIALQNKPENFGIKFGNEVITETKTIDLPAEGTEFQITGLLNNVCFYRAHETEGGITSAGVSENIDEEAANDIIARQLKGVTKLRTFRNYVCITDTVKGWSKTVPGVDTIINKYINNPFGL